MNHRFRGKIMIGDDGKFYFESSMWNFEGTQMIGEPFGVYGPWETESQCKAELLKFTELAVKACGEVLGEAIKGYLDMNDRGKYIEL